VLGRGRGGSSGLRRRLAAVGSGFVDTFLRDNRVLPPVLALLALLVFAWVVAGIFLGGPNDEQTSNRGDVAQSENPPANESPAPEVENRNAESYAAYQSKDPFRQLLPSAGETTAATSETTTTENTTGGGGGATGGGGGQDSDGDGLSDKRESQLGLDPFNPDTDGDGTLDGDERSAGGGGGGGNATGGAGGGGRNATGGAGGGGGGLFNSGGNLPVP
jgi:Bacterial TSP3 repeat